MAYQDWELYHNTKLTNGTKTTSSSSTNTIKNRSATNSTTKTKSATVGTTRRKTRKKVKKRKRLKPMAKNTLIMLLVATSLAGIVYAKKAEKKNENVDIPKETTSQNIVKETTDIQTHIHPDWEFTPDVDEEDIQDEYSEEELMDYKSYCYVGNYGDKQYLFCPEEYVLKIAEHSINKLNELYKSSGKMSILDNGECIPDCITPELLAAICYTESTYRIESVSGLPLGADRDCSASNRAEGMMQQKPVFVEDASNYSRVYGGEGYDNQDRYNPVTAMEICITNLTRIYRNYLQPSCTTYKNLGAKSPDDPKVLAALIVAYHKGEGSMQQWARNGNLSTMIESPNSTNDYGAVYYRTVMQNMNNVLEEDYSNS